MANNTQEWWDIDGVSLHQYGWSVSTIGGARYDLPPRKGSNIGFAYRQGQVHRPKLPDSRTIDLQMWLTGMDPATGAAPADQILQWNDSWDFLRRVVWQPLGAEVALTRRWLLTQNGTPGILTATAQAELADTMAPSMTGRTRAEFTMSFLLADPYFYGAEQTASIGGSTTVNNPGHDTASQTNFTVELTGTNPRLTNSTANPPVWVQYTGTIPGTLILDVGAYTALTTGGTNLINGITHSGARHWMGLLPGNNTLSFSGSGSALVRFRPPYV